MSNSSANKRIARNSIYMTIRMVIVLIVSLYTTRVILDVLGVEDYGLYNVVAGFVYMFTFLNGAMSSASQRFYNVELALNGISGAKIVFNASLRIHIIIGLIIVAVLEPIGLYYIPNVMIIPHGQLNAALIIFHFSVAAMFFNILCTPYTAAVMAHEKMDFYALVETLNVFLRLGMVLILPFLPGSKLIWYGFYYFLISIIILAIYMIYCYLHFSEIRIEGRVPRSMFKDMMSFSGWGIFGAIAYSLRDQGVNLVLNAFFGTIVNAARGIAAQVNGALSGFTSNLVIPSRPQVIQSYSQGDKQRAWTLTFSISKISFIVFFMMSLPVCFEIRYILKLWLGDDVPEYAGIFIILTLLTNTFGTLVSPVSAIIHATGKMKFYQILSSASNLMSVPLAYLFLVIYDNPILVYIALFITMGTNLLSGLISAHKYAELSYVEYVKSVFIPCITTILLSIPLCLPIYFIFPDSIYRFLTLSAYSFIVVAFISYRFTLNDSEKLMIRNITNKLLHRR